MSELPPRLSKRQKFILLAVKARSTEPYGANMHYISGDVCAEFGGWTVEQRNNGYGDFVKNNSHSASFSRSVSRLDDRGLLEQRLPWKQQKTGVFLTDEGESVADEILRRHNDGRFDLSFDTEPWVEEA